MIIIKWSKALFLSAVVLMLSAGATSLSAQSAGFVYVANSNHYPQPSSISAYSIDSKTGGLSAVPGSPFQAGRAIGSIAVDATGRFIYVTDPSASSILTYSIDGSTGSLTSVSGSPFATGYQPFLITVEPAGKFVYAQESGGIRAYAIDQTTGALTLVPGSPFPGGGYASAVTVDPTGRFLYLGYDPRSGQGRYIYAFSIDRGTGALTQISGSPFMIPTDPSVKSFFGPGPVALVAAPAANFFYVADGGQQDIWIYTLDGNTGALALTSSSPAFHLRAGFSDLSVDPTGQYAFLTSNYPNPSNCSNYYPYTDIYPPESVFAFSIDGGTGALTPVSRAPIQVAGYQPGSVAVDPSGQLAYVLNQKGYNGDNNSSSVSAYTISKNSGALNSVLGSPFPGQTGPLKLVVTAGPNFCNANGQNPCK